MNKKYVLFLALFFIFNSTVFSFANDTGCVYFFTENENLMYDESTFELNFKGDFTTCEKAFILYENLFELNDDVFKTFVPNNTKVIAVQFEDGHLKINVSSDIKLYGGTSWEEALLRQLLNTAFSLDEVTELSIFIDGWIDTLPEGSYLQNIKR